jgi:hypothetical protein
MDERYTVEIGHEFNEIFQDCTTLEEAKKFFDEINLTFCQDLFFPTTDMFGNDVKVNVFYVELTCKKDSFGKEVNVSLLFKEIKNDTFFPGEIVSTVLYKKQN